MSAQNIDCGYSLESPRRGGSNEYPQSMFLSRNKKIIHTPVNPSFTIWKWGLRGSTLYRHVFVMNWSFVISKPTSKPSWPKRASLAHKTWHYRRSLKNLVNKDCTCTYSGRAVARKCNSKNRRFKGNWYTFKGVRFWQNCLLPSLKGHLF